MRLDPDDRARPKTQKELRALQEKYMHFQVSNYLLTDEKLADAIAKVKRSYERTAKKMKEYKDEDLYTNYLNAFGHGLDSHTAYFSADMLKDFEISMRLSLQGIGRNINF